MGLQINKKITRCHLKNSFSITKTFFVKKKSFTAAFALKILEKSYNLWNIPILKDTLELSTDIP